MTLIARRAIYSTGGGWFHLPTYSGELLIEPQLRTGEINWIPFQGLDVPYAHVEGWKIVYSFDYLVASFALGVAFYDDLWDALVDTDGHAREELTFCDFLDTDGIRKGMYRSCKLISPLSNISARARLSRRMTIELLSMDGQRYVTAPAGETPEVPEEGVTLPGAGPYEDSIPEGGEATTPVPSEQLLTIPFSFAGTAEVTDGDNEHIMQAILKIPGTSGDYNIKGIQVYCDGQAAPDNPTRVKVSNAAWDGGGSVIAATVAAAGTNARGTGTITGFEPGDAVYVFFDQAGGHNNVVGCVEVISA